MAFILSKQNLGQLLLQNRQASATTNLSFSLPSLLPMEKLRSALKSLHGGAAAATVTARASPKRQHSRFFFSPTTSSSIMEAAGGAEASSLCRGSKAVAVASSDPYGDFRASMEEMVVVAAGGAARDWRALRELLRCYLQLNEEQNHGVIMLAFSDLLLNLLASSSAAAE